MSIAVRLFTQLTIWTAILAIFFTLVLLLTGSGDLGTAVASFMVLGGLAVVLAAFPAGIATSKQVLTEAHLRLGPLLEFAVATAGIGLLVLVLVGWIGPSAAAAIQGSTDTRDPVAHARTLTLGELRAVAVAAVARAEADSLTPPDERWQSANILVWNYVRRLASVAQPVLFAWLGLLAGFWAPRLGRRELEQAQYWALGSFLVISTYLAGENSFELIALPSAGPAFFAGWFVLLVPAILLVGIGWPTALMLWTGIGLRSAP